MSKVKKFATAVMAGFMLAACSGASDAPSGDGLSDDTLVIALGPDPAFAAIAVAIEKGWFEEVGFTSVETQEFVAGVEAGQALVAGEVDLWQPASVPAISLMNTGAPVSIVGEGSKCHVESLLVRSDAGVSDPEDLYDVTIASLQGSSLNAYLANLAEHYELDVEKLDIVNMAPAESLTSLIEGDIDAAVTFPPSTHRAITEADTVEVAGRVSGFGRDEGEPVDFSQTRCVLVMQDKYIKEHADSGEAALQAILRAQQFITDNEADAQEIYAEFSGQSLESVKAAWVSYQFPTELDDEFLGDLESYSDFLKESGAITGEPVAADDLVDLSLLERAQSAK